MNYYFINSDSEARYDVRTCDLWFYHSMAFSGNNWEKFGLPLRDLKPFDICLMYHNGSGIVGIGRVLEEWDGKRHSDKLLYLTQDFPEYRISIDWHIDIRKKPIDPQSEFGYIPRGFLNPILKYKDRVSKLVRSLETQIEYRGPDELYLAPDLREGNVRVVTVDIHERNPIARRKCIDHYGAVCNVCGFTFSEFYGPIGDGLIHVHHISPISKATASRLVDPVKDLRPVCANCHSIIHKKYPPFSIEEVKKLIKDMQGKDRVLNKESETGSH
jgi:hypothetical protein